MSELKYENLPITEIYTNDIAPDVTEPAPAAETAEKPDPAPGLAAPSEASAQPKPAAQSAETESPEAAAESAEETAEAGSEGISAGKKKRRRKWVVSPLAMILAMFMIFTLFAIMYGVVFPVNMQNLGGTHSWLEASTIKYTNYWLNESPKELHYLNVESPKSVEFTTLEERNPNYTVPSGTTMVVYLAAKAFGQDEVSVEFLKQLQQLIFMLNAVLVALFAYILAAGSGYRSATGKMFIGFMLGTLWMFLPVNAWYLSNVFYADQCVILWVLLFLPLEYLIRRREQGGFLSEEEIGEMTRRERQRKLRYGGAGLVLLILRFPVIFTGMQIDYYFWVLVLVAMITEFLGDMLNGRGLIRSIRRALGYAVPAVLGIAVFLIRTGPMNWLQSVGKYFLLQRDRSGCWETIRELFIQNFANGSDGLFKGWIVLTVLILVLSVIYLIQRGPTRLFRDPQCSILVTGAGAILLYTLLFTQYTAAYEFSMIKFSWWAVMTIPTASALILKVLAPPRKRTGVSRNSSLSWLMVCFVLMFAVVMYMADVPESIGPYVAERSQVTQYAMEKTIGAETGENDVCFSFTYEIPEEPPHALAMSGKRVYTIEDLDDIDTMFPNLSMKARRLMIIDRSSDQATKEQQKVIEKLMDEDLIIFKDSRCVIAKIPYQFEIEDEDDVQDEDEM